MIRGLLLQLLTLVLVSGAVFAAPSQIASFVAVAILIGCVSLIGVLVSAPRAQWLVPTVFRGVPGKNVVAFTFDDGPDPMFTPQVLERLAAHGAKATFFVVGARAEQFPDLVRRTIREGHELGSHSYGHGLLFHFSRARAMAREIQRGIDVVKELTGKSPRFFRPPQGLRVPTLRDALGMLNSPPICVTWSARGLDTLRSSPSAIVKRLAPAIQDGAIITLHDGGGLGGSRDRAPTVLALEELLLLAKARGLRCVRLDELLAAAPMTASSGAGT